MSIDTFLKTWIEAARRGKYDERVVSYVEYVKWGRELWSWTDIALKSHRLEDTELMVEVSERFGFKIGGSFYCYLKEVYNMKNNVHDKRRVRLEDMDNHIPFKEGRPKRDTVINGDDILNLQIALNTSNNFESFLKGV